MKKLIKKISYKFKKKFPKIYAKNFYEKKLLKCIGQFQKATTSKENPENILFINTVIGRGGAARGAYDNLCKPLNEKGVFNTNILAAYNYLKNDEKNVYLLHRDASREQQLLYNVESSLGWLDFFQTQSLGIKNMEVFKNSDILHLHNLHGFFFSPFALPELSSLKPTIWTLHDEQSFTGHCAYSFDCDKWMNECGNCPDLEYYPALERDTTSYLLNTKKNIYDNSGITLTCPSEWLKKRLEKSIWKNHDIRLIRYGIDENVFINSDKPVVREELNLPADKKILLFSADASTDNPQKGGKYIKEAYESLRHNDDLLFIAIGGDKTEYVDKNFLKVSYVFEDQLMAKYYAAADLFIFPTLADNLPFVVLESLSCGTPVITFNTGGVPEEVEHLKTGYIAKYKDINDFIAGINLFIENEELRKNASIEARAFIEKYFKLDISLKNYSDLYFELYDKAKQL